MPENTLLGLVGNLLGFDMPKSTTSADLPPLREMAHSYIDQIKESYDHQQQRDVQIQGQGLGLLDMVGGMAKAGAMIPSLTKQYKLASTGQSQLSTLIKKIAKERKLLSDENIRPIISQAHPLDKKSLYLDASKERIALQVYEQALKQYKNLGAARPGTEDFIQKLIKQLGK